MASLQGLPSGTVTLLFADVEGSTRLLNILGARFGPARARMRELVREAARANGGAEVDWAGDGVFLAFPRARGAVAAAAQIQRSLAAEPWPDEEAHRLRIGLHTGEPELGADGYIGIDVVVAARICAATHGEQVVVSQATRDVAGESPLAEASYRPLGRHRLKDVPAAVQLFQLVAPGLRDEFPPLKTLTASSLPALHHRLVGREDALARVEGLLHEQRARLVTITGPGGAGKSRLALEVAARAALERPVHLVGLAPVSEAELVPSAIARAVGVRESAAQQLLDLVAERLNGTGALLYLDNLEHLGGAATHVAGLLDRAADLQILATSRTPLRLSTEHVLPLEPLSIEHATTLFVELAAARGVILQEDALTSVHEICRRLDGLPLAIELVAARLAVLPPAEIVRALGAGLALEMEGPVDLPERQRTLRAAIDWSYRRLTQRQQLLHGMLAVFSDGAALEDARAVAPDTTSFLSDLEALVGWSLIRSEARDGSVRLSMLETVREHALRELEVAGRLHAVRDRHAGHFLEVVQEAAAELERKDQRKWLDRLELELDNLRSCFMWLLSSGREVEVLQAASSLGPFWRAHGHVSEARNLLTKAIVQAPGLPDETHADALWWSARLAAAQDDTAAEVPLLEEALELLREMHLPEKTAFVLGELGWIALQEGDRTRAEALCNEALALARTTGDARTISGQLNYLADVHSSRGDHAGALVAHEEALALRRTLDDPMLVVNSTYNLGIAAWENGEVERSRQAFEDAHARAADLGDVLHGTAAEFMLAELDLGSGHLDDAERRIRRCLARYSELENERSQSECLVVLGGIASARGHKEQGARLFGAAEALRSGQPPNRFEAPVLDRYVPQLRELLGHERVEALLEEGAHLELDDVTRRLVSSHQQE
jgi:predicted ATPase/class 3 adenylate cyclase